MDKTKILICGLPGSGKTTFLGALWYLVFNRDISTSLSYHSFPGNTEHLKELSSRWQQCIQVDRTKIPDEKYVEILFSSGEKKITVIFPDLSGEHWRSIWEDRTSSPDLASLVSECTGILLFIHADQITLPISVVKFAAQSEILGEVSESEQEVPYASSEAPTQVKIVDILQLMSRPPFDSKYKRLAIILSAWDLVEDEGRTPKNFLAERLSILNQYLCCGADYQEWKVYGVSAQGGDLEKDADKLRKNPNPSKRIRVFDGESLSHDLTLPLKWLMETSQ